MDISFIGEQDQFVVVYLDDITVFSKNDAKHIEHLRRTFEKCRRYGLSLNPQKSLFALKEGKILGHILTKDGVKIDPKRVEVINGISFPINRKEVQVFLGRINFLTRFIPNYVEIVRHITDMLKKSNEVKWSQESREAFARIKNAFAEAPVLAGPDCAKPFMIFSFSSPHTIAGVLLQKNEEGYEKPIAFFSQVLCDAELKYKLLEKQAYALVKSLKAFCVYILQSHIAAFVPTAAVKDILIQGDSEGKRGKWIAKIQEYELDIHPTKMIKGQGLAKILSESNY